MQYIRPGHGESLLSDLQLLTLHGAGAFSDVELEILYLCASRQRRPRKLITDVVLFCFVV